MKLIFQIVVTLAVFGVTGCGGFEFSPVQEPITSVPPHHKLDRNTYAHAVDWRHQLDRLVGRPVFHMRDGEVRLGERCVMSDAHVKTMYIEDGKVLEATVDYRADAKLKAVVLDNVSLDNETMMSVAFADVLFVCITEEQIDRDRLRKVKRPQGCDRADFIMGVTLSSLVRKEYKKFAGSTSIGRVAVPAFSFGYGNAIYASGKSSSVDWRIHCTELPLASAAGGAVAGIGIWRSEADRRILRSAVPGELPPRNAILRCRARLVDLSTGTTLAGERQDLTIGHFVGLGGSLGRKLLMNPKLDGQQLAFITVANKWDSEIVHAIGRSFSAEMVFLASWESPYRISPTRMFRVKMDFDADLDEDVLRELRREFPDLRYAVLSSASLVDPTKD